MEYKHQGEWFVVTKHCYSIMKCVCVFLLRINCMTNTGDIDIWSSLEERKCVTHMMQKLQKELAGVSIIFRLNTKRWSSAITWQVVHCFVVVGRVPTYLKYITRHYVTYEKRVQFKSWRFQFCGARVKIYTYLSKDVIKVSCYLTQTYVPGAHISKHT